MSYHAAVNAERASYFWFLKNAYVTAVWKIFKLIISNSTWLWSCWNEAVCFWCWFLVDT